MIVRTLTAVVLSALVLCSCSDPNSPKSVPEAVIERDIRFLTGYENALCGIREQYVSGTISRGRCLALYYEFKEIDNLQEEKVEAVKRVGYVLANPDMIDEATFERLSKITTTILDCNSYISQQCM